MNIVIDHTNLKAIQNQIDLVNGRARQHTITDANIILQLAEQFEEDAETLVGAKRRLPGTQVSYTSGGQVYASYRYSRYVNRVIMRRGKRNWHLVLFKRISVFSGSSRSSHISLTPAQDRDVRRHFQKQYSVRCQRPKSE